jgi:RNA polymerase sigma-70 factor (ECF subfamily)
MAVRRGLIVRDDPQLRARGSASDVPALRALYEDYLAAIYGFIYSKVGNREEAEDLTAQVFLKAVHLLDQARAAGSMESWLFRVARTTVADHWRQFYRLRVHSLDDLLDGGWEGPAEERSETPSERPEVQLQGLLQKLPERYRQVLTYRFLLNHSIRETATKMHLSVGNVKILQLRALKKAAGIDDAEA